MPICGFNPLMLAGLRQFGEGLLAQAKKRVEKDKLSFIESIDAELEEMDIFLDILKQKDPVRHQALIGVTNLAQALYRPVQGVDLPDAEKQYLEALDRTNAFFKELDDMYYEKFLPGVPPREALKKLGEWIE